MMVIDLLKELKRFGVTLKIENDSLKVHAPKNALTKELQKDLLENKSAIMKWLLENEVKSSELPQCEINSEALYEPFPLSDLQLGFYMGDKDFMEFHVRPHYYLENNSDNLDIERYQAAWNKALNRHAKEISVVRDDGTLMVLKDLPELKIVVVDLTHLAPEKALLELDLLRLKMMRSELPLDVWPWIDLRVSVWSDNGKKFSRIHYNHNNFFSDGYGTTRLMQEVDRYYDQPTLTLPPINLTFRDAAIGLDDLAKSALGQKARKYWEDRLPELPGPPDLPVVTGKNRRCRSRLQRRSHKLSAEAWSSIKQTAKSVGLTPSNAVFSIYMEIISTWSNSRHFVVSNMMTRRLDIHPQIYDIIGNFASLYPLEVDLRQGKTFVERAQQLQAQVMKDSENLHWGGMQVMQALNRLNDSLGVAAIPFVVGSGLFMEDFKPADFSCLETSQVMLDHQFWELNDGGYYYVWDLLEDFFPESMIDAMWNAYASLLERLAENSSAWFEESFDLCPKKQLLDRAKLCEFSDLAGELRLEELLVQSAQKNSANIAFSTVDNFLTYEQLNRGSDSIAVNLSKRGVNSGDRVAIAAARGGALLQAVFGVLKCGGVYVPIDVRLPQDRINYILEHSLSKVVLVDSSSVPANEWSCNVIEISNIYNDVETDEIYCIEKTNNKDTDLAYVIFTSGSTGLPKGVMIDHRGVANTVRDVNQRFSVTHKDVIFGVSSFGFDLSVYDIFGAVSAGAKLIYPEANNSMNPSHWLDLLASEEVSVWNSAPPLAQLLADAAESRAIQLPSLRLVMLSGDWIPLDLPAKIKMIAPNAHVVSLGGATEASIWSIYYPIDEVKSDWNSIPYGFPMLNQPWYILDENKRAVPEWTPGDLYIGGIGLAKGYWNDEEKTNASFVTHPTTGERIYRTGDIGRYIRGGAIEFLGRQDSQIKIQGHRIELGEIEVVITSYPDVSKAVVVAQKTGIKNQLKLGAYLVLTPGVESFNWLMLRTYLEKKLPDYMIPGLYSILEDFPITSNGKIDRKNLPSITDEKISDKKAIEKRSPRGYAELAILELWQKVLNVDVIDATDSFFDIGGQSFEAVRLVGLIKDRLGCNLSPADIWRENTIEKLARHIETKSLNTNCYLSCLDSDGSGIPLLMIHPAGGQVLCYRSLAQKLNRPVFAFEAPGIKLDEAPLAVIEEFAKLYIDEFNKLDWIGPVILGGWSSGAPIAFEMAHRLTNASIDVRGIVLIDSPAPVIHGPVDEVTMFNWFASDLDLSNQDLKDFVAFNNLSFTFDERFKKLKSLSSAPKLNMQELEKIYSVFTGMVTATRNYYPPKIKTNILSLRAADGLVEEFSLHPNSECGDWGWAQFTTGSMASAMLSGTHYTLLLPENVGQVSNSIEDWILNMKDGKIISSNTEDYLLEII